MTKLTWREHDTGGSRVRAAGRQHTRVAIVVADDIGAQLPGLAERFDVWVLDTPANRRAAEAIWAVSEGASTASVTTFKRNEGQSMTSSVEDILPVGDEHHGLRADWADDVVLEVLGQPLTDGIRAALEALGPFSISKRHDGFTATRTRLTAPNTATGDQ